MTSDDHEDGGSLGLGAEKTGATDAIQIQAAAAIAVPTASLANDIL